MGTTSTGTGQPRELWLFTARFPKGFGEFSLEHELPHLARNFDRVRIFPLLDAGQQRPVPGNVEVSHVLGGPHERATAGQILKNFSLILKVLLEVARGAPSIFLFLKRSREILSSLRQGLARMIRFESLSQREYDPDRVVMYSNWAEDWATILGMCNLNNDRIRFVTRLRGFDLYDHRARDGWQVFQSFNLKQASHIYTTSKAGTDHVLARYPQLLDKISVSPTATVDHGPAPWWPDRKFRIVSCSNLYPIKRVPLIAEAVIALDIPVQWTHFGDGNDRQKLERIAAEAPSHISIELKGALPNKDVIAWYQKNPVDLFIHASSTEGGVAVVLQEAASFGIPLLAADAGGVKEIVGPETGELLPLDVTTELLRKKITEFKKRGHDPELRERIRRFWRAHFQADIVHDRFAKDLLRR